VNSVLLSILGTMLSFAISLRVGSANDRFNEGRRAWSSITLNSRNLAFLIWLHAPETTLTAAQLSQPRSADELDRKLKCLIEKRTMINLIEAFSVATKHYLRNEPGVYYEDLYHLVLALPKYSFPSSVEEEDRTGLLGLWRTPMGDDGKCCIPSSARRRGTAAPGVVTPLTTIELKPASNPPPTTIYHYCPPLIMLRPIFAFFARSTSSTHRSKHKNRIDQASQSQVNANVPLEISLFVSNYIHQLIKRATLEPAMFGTFMGPTLGLQDCFTTLEKVLTTPLPFAYSAHLRFSVYIYLLFLPFQIQTTLGWVSIGAVCVASIIFLGFIELGTQLEQPFGYDDSDLDLDHFCSLLSSELHEIVAHPNPSFDFVFSEENQPFGPHDARTAGEILSEKKGTQEFKKMLVREFHRKSERVGKVQKNSSKDTVRSVEVFSI
ncbi:UPF0187-domain-containing protein, partial [Meredithblackwellia eburnea MCA 4105]